jgi:hypothetical protein
VRLSVKRDESILRIPKKIHFLGIDWKVTFVDDLINSNNHFAEIAYNTHKIRIQHPKDGCEVNAAMSDVSFLHEIVHLMLNDMQSDLASDEKFVDQFALYLYAMQKDNKIFK